jgi:hypothetical protein
MPSQYFENYGVISLTAASTTITDEGFVGSRLVFNRAAGATAILPAATGSGNRYEFIVGTTLSGGNYVVRVANSSDIFVGWALFSADAGDTAVMFETAADSDTITMNGTGTGGVRGARVIVDDIAANLWAVNCISNASGTEATPFSAAV